MAMNIKVSHRHYTYVKKKKLLKIVCLSTYKQTCR